MENTKMTIAENYANVKAFLEANGADEAMVAFIVDRAEKAVRKSTSKSGPTDEQIALRQTILEVLGNAGKPISISEMQKLSDVLGACSTSKISGNITPMLQNGKNPNPNGKIVRSMDKKVAKFCLC